MSKIKSEPLFPRVSCSCEFSSSYGFGLDASSAVDPLLRSFTSPRDPLRVWHWAIFTCDVKDIVQIVPKKDYTLVIVDIPYGYRLRESFFDESAFTYQQILHVVKSFKEITTASLWIIISFHSTNQAAVVAKALKDETHGYESMIWATMHRVIVYSVRLK